MKRELTVKSPCSESWEKMEGGDAVRYCRKCQFNVYRFSEMTGEEIDDVLNNNERVCARLYIRADGTYMTKDCKTKVKRKRILKYFGLAALIPLSLALFNSRACQRAIDGARTIPVIGDIINKLNPYTYTVQGECAPATRLPAPPPAPPAPASEETQEN